MAVAAARFPKKFFMPDPLRLLADDGADHDEPGGREGPTTKPRDQPPVSEILDGPEVRLAQVLPILHRALAPLGQMHIPQRTVSALGRIPAQDIERAESIKDGRVQALSLGVVHPGLTVGEGCQGSSR